MDRDPLTERIIGAAIEVHRTLGPGLLESAYEACLCRELAAAGISFRRQVPIPVRYKEVDLDCGFRADLVVEEEVMVEIKAIDRVAPLHQAQLLTYLKLAKLTKGLLINFNTTVLKDGVKRFVL